MGRHVEVVPDQFSRAGRFRQGELWGKAGG